MSFSTEAVKAVRIPLRIFEVDLPYCQNTVGVPPCTSTQSGTNKCFNTRCAGSFECGDPANFNPVIKTYRFCEDIGHYVPNALPCIAVGGIAIVPPKLEYLGGLGTRSSATVELQDFAHNDIDVDKYFVDRDYSPIAQGTYFGKQRARNPYYRGATCRIYDGFWTEDFSMSDFTSMEFIIDRIDGPTGGIKGKVKYILNDRLIKAFAEESVYPIANTSTIQALLSDTGTTFSLLSGEGANYEALGYISLGSEIVSFTRSGDVFTIGRSQFNTDAEEHEVGIVVQQCAFFENVLALSAFQTILEDGCSIPTAKINLTDISSENAAWMESYYVNRLIPVPTPCDELLDRLGKNTGFNMWVDLQTGQVRCKAIRPNTEDLVTYNDYDNILADSVIPTDSPRDRISTAIVYYGIKNPIGSVSDDLNYYGWAVWKDVESETLNDEKRVRIFYAPWIAKENHLDASSLANNYILRSKLTPTIVRFDVDAKDGVNINLADPIKVETSALQSPTGAANTKALQVLQKASVHKKNKLSQFSITAMDYQFDARYLILMEEGVDPENYSAASEDIKYRGGYLCDDFNVMPSDGADGYKLA
jgi:hypothetical protein